MRVKADFDVAVGRYHVASDGIVKTTGVSGCLGIVMHDPERCRGAVGHAFDQAGNTELSLPAAKMLILSMICGLGGHEQSLELFLFNGGGLDGWKWVGKTGLVELITSMKWRRVMDLTAATTGKLTTSSFVLYEPETGVCRIGDG